jgi:hypothetical protein
MQFADPVIDGRASLSFGDCANTSHGGAIDSAHCSQSPCDSFCRMLGGALFPRRGRRLLWCSLA